MSFQKVVSKAPAIVLALCLGLSILHCGQSTQNNGGTTTTGGTTAGTTTGGTGGTGVQRNVSLGGQVSNSAVLSGFKELTTLTAPCDGTFSVYEIGGDGNAIAAGTASNGAFSIDYNTTVGNANDLPAEVELSFDCSSNLSANLKCFGKPGDANLLCDIVADIIVNSLETAINANVTTSADFQGLSVATIAAGLAETLKLVANINPSDNYITQLTQASSASAAAAILANSPVGALFQSLQTLAQQVVAQNTATTVSSGTWPDPALAAVWTPGKIITLLVGLGVNVEVDFDSGNNVSIYDPLFYAVGQITDPNYIVGLQTFSSDLYNQVYNPNASSQPYSGVTLVCQAQYNGQGNWQPPVIYPPEIVAGDSNGMVAHVPKFTCLGSNAAALNINPQNFRVAGLVMSATQEPDRNNPTGSNNNNGGDNNNPPTTSLIDIFPEFQTVMMNDCNQYVDPNSMNNNGPPTFTDVTGFASCIKAQGADKYFAGVLGVYRFFTDPALQGISASLNDLYGAIVDRLNIRLTAQFPFGGGYNVQFSDPNLPYGNQTYMPLFVYNSALTDQNNEIYYTLNGNPSDPSPLSPSYSNTYTMSVADYNQLIAEATPDFSTLFSDFLQLPTFATIKQWIFTSDHHVDYNIAGDAFYSSVGKQTDPTQYSANVPVFCAIMQNSQPVKTFTPGVSHITCQVASGTWTNGVSNNPNQYIGWYLLQGRENIGAEQYYALIDSYSGAEFTRLGQTFRIRDLSNQAPGQWLENSNTIAPDGTTLQHTNKLFCYSNMNSSGQISTNCYQEAFDYVAMEFPNANSADSSNPAIANPNLSIFPPQNYNVFSVQVTINQSNPSGGSSQMNMPIAVASDNNSMTDQNSQTVCMSTSGVVPSAQIPQWAMSIDPNKVDYCNNIFNPSSPAFDPNSNGQYYYLQLGFAQNSNHANYTYNLVRNDGLWMGNSTGQGPATVLLTDVETVLSNRYGMSVYLAPATQLPFLLYYNVANPSHQSRFDPYCLDLDHSGYCDCFRDPNGTGDFSQYLGAHTSPSDSQCNINDIPGNEPTLSTAPANDNDPSSQSFWYYDGLCQNQNGAALATCLTSNPNQGVSNNVNWQAVVRCAENPNVAPSYVDIGSLTNPQQAALAGGNCMGQSGPVVLMPVVPRQNAYNIARPQMALKLISQATQDTGTGVNINPNQSVFAFTDAVALTFFRVTIPADHVEVRGPNYNGPPLVDNSQTRDPNNFITYNDVQLQFTQAQLAYTTNNNDSGNTHDPLSAILRVFLTKGGYLP